MKSKVIGAAAAAALLTTAPASVQAASLRIAGIVPVSCAAEFVSGSVANRRLTISVRRSCNTFHTILVRGDEAESLGDIHFLYNGIPAATLGSEAIINQSDRFYDGVDQLTIEVSKGDDAALMQFASSLRIELETT